MDKMINPALLAEVEKMGEVKFAKNKYICEVKENEYNTVFKLAKVDYMPTPLENISVVSEKKISVATCHAIMLVFIKKDGYIDLDKIEKFERQPTVIEVLSSRTRYVSGDFFEAIFNGRLESDIHCYEYLKLCLGL